MGIIYHSDVYCCGHSVYMTGGDGALKVTVQYQIVDLQ